MVQCVALCYHTRMFDKKHKKKFQGFFIVLSVLMIVSMVLLYMPIFR